MVQGKSPVLQRHTVMKHLDIVWAIALLASKAITVLREANYPKPASVATIVHEKLVSLNRVQLELLATNRGYDYSRNAQTVPRDGTVTHLVCQPHAVNVQQVISVTVGLTQVHQQTGLLERYALRVVFVLLVLLNPNLARLELTVLLAALRIIRTAHDATKVSIVQRLAKLARMDRVTLVTIVAVGLKHLIRRLPTPAILRQKDLLLLKLVNLDFTSHTRKKVAVNCVKQVSTVPVIR